jgi:hypothetical protein
MFHDYRMAKAVQEQKQRDAQRPRQEDQIPAPAEQSFRQRFIARLVRLLPTRSHTAGRTAARSELDRGQIA